MYDVAIIGAGPGGIYSAYELIKLNKGLKIVVLEEGNPLEKRKCPIDGKKVKSCINCKTCAIMNGFGGAGAFSDGKYNITNQLAEHCMNTSAKKKLLTLCDMSMKLIWHMAAKEQSYILPQIRN